MNERFTESENEYRRGYSHGFVAARMNSETTVREVINWREGDESVGPPGSMLSGKHIPGLIINDLE